MGGEVGIILNDYGCPLAGIGLLGLGAWSSWQVWRPARIGAPSLTARLAAPVLGLVGGWFLANLEYAPDPLHLTVGFPMPVVTLVRHPGQWMEPGSSASATCLALNLIIGAGLANGVLWLGRGLGRRVRGRRLRSSMHRTSRQRPGAGRPLDR